MTNLLVLRLTTKRHSFIRRKKSTHDLTPNCVRRYTNTLVTHTRVCGFDLACWSDFVGKSDGLHLLPD